MPRSARDQGERLAISSVSLFELWYGVAKSERVEQNTERLADFLSALEILQFDEDAAPAKYEPISRSGRPIGACDDLIAGQALRKDLLSVTANVSEISRIRGLRWEDWSDTR